MKKILVRVEDKKYEFITPKGRVFQKNGVSFFWFFFEGKHLCATQQKTGGWIVSGSTEKSKETLIRNAA
jgi:hypothetical protein